MNHLGLCENPICHSLSNCVVFLLIFASCLPNLPYILRRNLASPRRDGDEWTEFKRKKLSNYNSHVTGGKHF